MQANDIYKGQFGDERPRSILFWNWLACTVEQRIYKVTRYRWSFLMKIMIIIWWSCILIPLFDCTRMRSIKNRIQPSWSRVGPGALVWVDCGRLPPWSACGTWAARTQADCRWHPSHGSPRSCSSPSSCPMLPTSARTVAVQYNNVTLLAFCIQYSILRP